MKMDFKRIYVIFLAVLFSYSLTGCLKVVKPEIKIKEAVLFSPKGKFKFKIPNSPKDGNSISVYDGKFIMMFALFPHPQGFLGYGSMLTIKSKNKNALIKIKPSFYQYNSNRDKVLSVNNPTSPLLANINYMDHLFKKHSIQQGDGDTIYYNRDILIPPPHPMKSYRSSGASLRLAKPENSSYQITKEHITRIESEWYRYKIHFTIDDQPYAIDVTFRLGINSSYRITVTGTP